MTEWSGEVWESGRLNLFTAWSTSYVETEYMFNDFKRMVQVYIYHYIQSSARSHVCRDWKKLSTFTLWQQSLYHPALKLTQAYDVSGTLFMPLAAERMFYHGSTSPSLVLYREGVWLYWAGLNRCRALCSCFIRWRSRVALVSLQPHVIGNIKITFTAFLLLIIGIQPCFTF